MIEHQKHQPVCSITVTSSRSHLNEDIIVSHAVTVGELAATSETRYPAGDGEALTREFRKGLRTLRGLMNKEHQQA
jgi:hypothetical protein